MDRERRRERCILNTEQEERSFNEYGLQGEILEDLSLLGYQKPTPIQAQCIPLAMEGKDIIGLAQTGTGKTAAFGLPTIHRAIQKPEMTGLVLAPTRELAQQIAKALQDMGTACGIRVAVVVGGIPLREDHVALRSWPNILVATPGRLIDHIESGTVGLKDIEILSVDEADRMYDMGFMPQVERILEELPEDRQTFMFTATMPKEVERLVRRHMRSPERIQVGLTAPAKKAQQRLYSLEEDDKLSLLLQLLSESHGRVLVFVRTKRKVEQVYRRVCRKHSAAKLHGDREQIDRDIAMRGFRSGQVQILVATDIAARGIDVANIEHVINYDFPGCPEDYIHRIGRTARVAASGIATSFVTRMDRSCLKQLEKLINEELPFHRIRSHDRTTGNRRKNPRRRQRSSASS